MAATLRIRADLRLAAHVLKPSVLLLLLFVALASAWLAPFLWLAFADRVVHNADFKLILFGYSFSLWCCANFITFKDLQAISQKRRVSAHRGWFVEIPRSTRAWAADLIDSVESMFPRYRWKLQLHLSLVPGVQYSRVHEGSEKIWRTSVGLSTIAFLSAEELRALLATSALCRLSCVSRPCFVLIQLLRSAERWKSALPPHPGLSSFARWFIEGVVSILKSVPDQLEEWSVDVAAKMFDESTVRSATVKSQTASLLQGSYINFYEHTAIKRGLMPPYVEGLWRLYGKTIGGAHDPAFKALPGLWVYERRLMEGWLGRDSVTELRPASWDELHQNIGPSWSESAAELRGVLGDSRVADIPKLVCEWRNFLRRWLVDKQRAPVVTPDRQRELFLFLLSAALGEVLLQAGWQVRSGFGEEISLVKDSRVLSPFRLVNELSSGKLSSAQYERECSNAEIGHLALGVSKGRLVGPGARFDNGLHVHGIQS